MAGRSDDGNSNSPDNQEKVEREGPTHLKGDPRVGARDSIESLKHTSSHGVPYPEEQ